ncbi:hypothetical protein F0562_020902 [Nyssa sinensis]|uniref:Uncharacterized protein n=1 Tax=Nyssa sinensis TaxID=561372 RepID=A0A5J5BV48_9ASTE|nr:hypothetical protein F0562_020902 [Nyssa sinensis]
MVCQAATQTRFRALKHENGIAGRATIIVRVIACFQPLQDCQAEYFRHLLKPVTKIHILVIALTGWLRPTILGLVSSILLGIHPI